MRESRTYGSVRGALSDGRPYRDRHFPGDVLGLKPQDVVLLRHRIGAAWVDLRGALQHGHRARGVARATIRCRRIVAIEFATCRSGRTGGASGWTTLGNLRRRALIGVAAGG